MNRENILRFIGLARKAGKLAVGKDASLNAASKGKARIVVVASDIDPKSLEKMVRMFDCTGTETVVFGTRSELGNYLGMDDCTVIAITDGNFAGKIREMIKCGQKGQNTRGCSE